MPQRHLTRAETRDFDRRAIEHFGIPALVLMENAGRGAVDVMQSLGVRGPVLICCGKGNNGGDGLVAARLLRERGRDVSVNITCDPGQLSGDARVIARHLANRAIPVKVLLFANPDDLSADAATQWRIVQRLRLPAEAWPNAALDRARLTSALAQAEWVVDALFGTGLSGPMRPPFDQIAACINDGGARILAVDIPSGLDADSGLPMGPTIRAEHTVTFVAPKIGFAQAAAAPWLGQLHVADIGLSLQLAQEINP
jgi:NAD(P)H-hydrate epimerase